MRSTSISILADNRKGRAADTTFKQTTEQVLLPMDAIQGVARGVFTHLDAGFFLSYLDPVPQGVIDDSQVRHFDRFPLIGWIGPGKAFTGFGVFNVGAAIPDKPPNIEIVVENSGATIDLAPYRCISPIASTGAGDCFFVEPLGDLTRAYAGGVFIENPSNDVGLGIDDLTITDFIIWYPIAKSEATAGLAGKNASQ